MQTSSVSSRVTRAGPGTPSIGSLQSGQRLREIARRRPFADFGAATAELRNTPVVRDPLAASASQLEATSNADERLQLGRSWKCPLQLQGEFQRLDVAEALHGVDPVMRREPRRLQGGWPCLEARLDLLGGRNDDPIAVRPAATALATQLLGGLVVLLAGKQLDRATLGDPPKRKDARFLAEPPSGIRPGVGGDRLDRVATRVERSRLELLPPHLQPSADARAGRCLRMPSSRPSTVERRLACFEWPINPRVAADVGDYARKLVVAVGRRCEPGHSRTVVPNQAATRIALACRRDARG